MILSISQRDRRARERHKVGLCSYLMVMRSSSSGTCRFRKTNVPVSLGPAFFGHRSLRCPSLIPMRTLPATARPTSRTPALVVESSTGTLRTGRSMHRWRRCRCFSQLTMLVLAHCSSRSSTTRIESAVTSVFLTNFNCSAPSRWGGPALRRRGAGRARLVGVRPRPRSCIASAGSRRAQSSSWLRSTPASVVGAMHTWP